MKHIFFFSFFLSLYNIAFSTPSIFVETFDEQSNNPTQLTLRLKITNNTPDTLKDIKATYYLKHKENLSINVHSFYLPKGYLSLDTLNDYIAINIHIPELIPGIFPNSSGISLGLNYDNYSFLDKTNHFSYQATTKFQENNRIAIYSQNILIAGTRPGILPDAEPFSLTSGSELLLNSNQSVNFAWREIDNANSYRFTLLSSKDSSLLIQQETNKNQLKFSLKEGNYLWRVESSEYNVGNSSWENSIQFDKYSKISVVSNASETIIDSINPLVTPRAARKDTYLLDLKWGEMALTRKWDRPHLDHSHYDEEESYRCWAVGAQILNHYYGGNITQDEIKLKFKNKLPQILSKDSSTTVLLGAFLHDAQGAMSKDSFNIILPWVLNENIILNKTNHIPSKENVEFWLKKSIPLYTWTLTHVMILDGYKKTIDGKIFVHLVNTDNDGNTAWINLETTKLEGFIVPQVTGDVRKTDSLIHIDSDNDGIMDYDEIMRFGTNPNNADSDGDCIDDKTEIMSYTILEPIEGDANEIKRGIKELHLSDIDKDRLRAEYDIDSDNGGLNDGEEDLNKNGWFESNETNPYYIYDDFIQPKYELDIPDTLTFYALGILRINDGVKCWKENQKILSSNRNVYCSIASSSQNQELAINIGRSASIRSIAAKGKIILRNYAMITGNIKIYSLPKYEIFPFSQASSSTKTNPLHLLESLWPYKVPTLSDSPNIENTSKEIFYNESYTLKDKDNFKSLKVHSGGTLLIKPGEMVIGNIQLESGSKILFSEPGRETIIHLNGSTIWRSKTLNDNLELVAKGFKIIQHSSETMIVEGEWAGTIFAPNADLILGQSSKTLYGQFIGNNVTVHQYATIYNVNFNPTIQHQIVMYEE